MFFAIENDKPS